MNHKAEEHVARVENRRIMQKYSAFDLRIPRRQYTERDLIEHELAQIDRSIPHMVSCSRRAPNLPSGSTPPIRRMAHAETCYPPVGAGEIVAAGVVPRSRP